MEEVSIAVVFYNGIGFDFFSFEDEKECKEFCEKGNGDFMSNRGTSYGGALPYNFLKLEVKGK